MYFEIHVDNAVRAKEFYTKVFDWKFMLDPEIPIEYWRITTADSPGGLLQRPAKTPPPQCGANAFVCSYQVEDFDKTSQIILDLGGQMALPKFAVTKKCWQGYFIDLDGNTFGIFQVDDKAGT